MTALKTSPQLGTNLSASAPGAIEAPDTSPVPARDVVFLLMRNLLFLDLAGPVDASRNGNQRVRGSFRLRFVAPAERTIKSIALNVANTPTHMVFNPNPPRFHVGVTDGIDPANISASYSADVKTVTLSFADGSPSSGDSFTFGLSVFAPADSPGEDPDRLQGAVITVTLDDGSVFTSTLPVTSKSAVNRFTGAG